MDINRAILELKAQKKRLDRAIATLERRRSLARADAGGTGRRAWSAAARRAAAERMLKFWEEKKRKAAAAAHAEPEDRPEP